MDIVVTIPKSRMAQVEAEEKQVEELLAKGANVNFFWGVHRRPKYLDIGDRCYFVWEGAIRAFHDVVGFGTDVQCDTTRIVHPGFCVILDPVVHNLDSPVPMKGFRGFQYYERPATSERQHRGDQAVGAVTRGCTGHQGRDRLGQEEGSRA